MSSDFDNKEYRDAFVDAMIRNGLAFQIRALRGDMTQGELAARMGTQQNVISRYEDPDYGSFALNTLKRLASEFNVALICRFAPFSELRRYAASVSKESVAVLNYDQEITSAAEADFGESGKVVTMPSIVRRVSVAPPDREDRIECDECDTWAEHKWHEKVEAAHELLATAYQLAGLVGAPVRFLDAYSRHEGGINSLLPVDLTELDEFKALQGKLGERTAERDKMFASVAELEAERIALTGRLDEAALLILQAHAGLNHVGAVDGVDQWNARAMPFLELAQDAWDRQIERDAAAGKLDKLFAVENHDPLTAEQRQVYDAGARELERIVKGPE